ncbi:MAG TPA: hypothetical protein DCF89_08190, partial [Flavobacteriales bacterium]|nr:hypothetical protein [Flavobacteriales bacterium]
GFANQYDNMMEFMFGIYNTDGSPWDYATGFPSLSNFGAQSQNVQTARITGFDIQLMGAGHLTDDLQFNIFSGYTYMNPISLNTDSAYVSTFSNDSTNMLKYRFTHLVKIDFQIDYKIWSVGLSARYNSFTPNIDKIFQTELIPGIAILPGMDTYRLTRNRGDWVFDSRIACQVKKYLKASFVIKNLLNREYMSRPGDVMPPRTYAVQMSFNF